MALEDLKTISQLIAGWTEMLEKHGDLVVVIDYDNQYIWSPHPELFRVVKNQYHRGIEKGKLILEAMSQ